MIVPQTNGPTEHRFTKARWGHLPVPGTTRVAFASTAGKLLSAFTEPTAAVAVLEPSLIAFAAGNLIGRSHILGVLAIG